MIKKFINKYKTSEAFRHILWITIVYVLTQGFLLIVSGIWWDDWLSRTRDWEAHLESALQQGLPLRACIHASLWFLPEGAYRILVFFYYYVGSLLVYTIMKKIDAFTSDAAFWITLLYIAIPINDARILLCCYDYQVGLFSFWIAFWLVTLWQGKNGRKAVVLRVLSLVILVFSYNTESIMLMTLVILLYLYYEKLKDGWVWNEVRANIRKFFKTVVYYMDFLLAPIIFYFGKKILFPTYGGYSGYRNVDVEALPELIMHSPIHAGKTMMYLLSNYIFALFNRTVLFSSGLIPRSLRWGSLLVLAVVVLCYLLVSYMHWRKEIARTEADIPYSNAVIMLIVGVFCFFSGFFAYAIYCNGMFETTWTTGRHSLLLGIGTAMIIYYLVGIVFRREIRKMVLVSFITLGVCHFNLMYLDWQEAYYQELRFQEEIAENQNILDNDTFLYLDFGWIFYVPSAISYEATGEESRFYLSLDRLSVLPDIDEDSVYLTGYHMCDWNYSTENRHLDGILLFNNVPISNSEVIKLKFEELYDKDAFNKWISETKDITFIPVTEKESDAIIKAHQEGILTRDNIFDYVGAY